jgi:DNA mismatch repair ATPase MutL
MEADARGTTMIVRDIYYNTPPDEIFEKGRTEGSVIEEQCKNCSVPPMFRFNL